MIGILTLETAFVNAVTGEPVNLGRTPLSFHKITAVVWLCRSAPLPPHRGERAGLEDRGGEGERFCSVSY
jgi:hypothetical protein